MADSYGAHDLASNPVSTIGRPDIDAVIVASQDATHAKLIWACIAAGKPELCETPLSPEPDDCVTVMEQEIAAGRPHVMLGFMRR